MEGEKICYLLSDVFFFSSWRLDVDISSAKASAGIRSRLVDPVSLRGSPLTFGRVDRLIYKCYRMSSAADFSIH